MAFSLKKLFKGTGRLGMAADKNAVSRTPKREDYLFLAPSLIPSKDASLPMASVKTYYKALMRHAGFTGDNDELSLRANKFYRELSSKEKYLRKLYDESKKELDSIEKKIYNRNKILKKYGHKKITGSIATEINLLKNSARQLRSKYLINKEEYDDFSNDKRFFLINYINTENHGSDWKEKYYKNYYIRIL